MKFPAFSFFIVTCLLLDAVQSKDVNYTYVSVRDAILAPLHTTNDVSYYRYCGSVFDAPYGKLIKSYSDKTQEFTCTFQLKAPSNHVVHFRRVEYKLMDEISKEDFAVHQLSSIYLYDIDLSSTSRTKIDGFGAARYQKNTYFVQSTSNTNNVEVEFKFLPQNIFKTVYFEVEYEFLDKDVMYATLRGE